MSIETLSAVAAPPSAGPDRNSAPRFVRLRDAPRYLGMDKNRFNRDVRPGCRRPADAWEKEHKETAPAGVSFEDRQDLLGHRSGRITTHNSQAELTSLIEAAERVCDTESRKSPATTWLRRKAG